MTDLSQAFLSYCRARPDDPAAHLFGTESAVLSRRDLINGAARAASVLATAGVNPGDRVVLALPTGFAFLYWFWGCQLAGAIPVPLEPVNAAAGPRAESQVARLVGIAHQTAAAVVVADRAEVLQERLDSARILAAAAWREGEDAQTRPVADDSVCAFIQFTSGSTGPSKGCVISHRAALRNADSLIEACGVRAGDEVYTWMPLHHDMGLMCGVIGPVRGDLTALLRPPHMFALRPLSFLRHLSGRPRVHSAAPNFAMRLLLTALARQPDETFDLAGLRTLVCGAEPIDAGLAAALVDALGAHGFGAEAFRPAYGMAETVVIATCGRGVNTRPPPRDGPTRTPLIDLGPPVGGGRVAILDGALQPVVEGQVGEIALASDFLMDGYYGDPDATAQALCDGWLLTGDLGLQADGCLFYVGRRKTLLVINGQNIAPSDLEAGVAAGLGDGVLRVACFGEPGAAGTDEIWLLAETRRPAVLESLAREAVPLCMAVCGAPAARIFAGPPGCIPTTSSGKIDRSRLRAACETERGVTQLR